MTPRPGQRPTQTIQLDALPDLTQGLTVKFDDVLRPETRRLMTTLGVDAVEPELSVRYHVPSSQVWPGSRGRARGRIHLYVGEQPLCKRPGLYQRRLEEGERAERCRACNAVAARRALEWPA